MIKESWSGLITVNMRMCFLAIERIDSRADGTETKDFAISNTAPYDNAVSLTVKNLPGLWLFEVIGLDKRVHRGSNTAMLCRCLSFFRVKTSDGPSLEAIDHTMLETIITKESLRQSFKDEDKIRS
jgi:hypothetical protein